MDSLFHYTDLNAFLSIIKSKKIWLTGVNNLNDHKEMQWAFSKIENHINEKKDLINHEKTSMFVNFLRSYAGVPYIFSLSCASDLLSQWRAYSQNGAGVAIGLKIKSLPSLRAPLITYKKENNVSLCEVIYDEKKQEEIIDSKISNILEGEINEKSLHDITSAAAELASISVLFKNPSFSEECEWRMVHKPLISENHDGSNFKIHQSISPPKYRISGARLITYFEYGFEEFEPDDIFSEIILGPKCEVSDFDLKILLKENGINYLNVRRSKASYR